MYELWESVERELMCLWKSVKMGGEQEEVVVVLVVLVVLRRISLELVV